MINLNVGNGSNKIELNYQSQAVIHELFNEQVKIHPHITALISNNVSLSYYDFNCAANKLANFFLKKFSQRSNCIISVLLDRSIEQIITIFAILKAGCAYLPLNPNEPTERMRFMLNDSGTSILVTQNKFKDRIDFSGSIIYLDEAQWEEEDKENPSIVYKQTDLAYIIYTSGTTGYPKGVMIEHKALLNRILWMQKQFPIATGDIILNKTPYTFDVSVWEIFWWSITGAGLSILNPEEHKDVVSIIRNIAKNKVTVMHFVPPLLSLFSDCVEANLSYALDEIASLRYVFCSGEALKPYQVNKFNNNIYRQNKTRLINLYGPTEATIDVTYFDCTGLRQVETVPIGKAIDNIDIYILDETGKPCEVGQNGELCITGVGLARGYLNRPELNAQKFVPLPWDANKRMYRTGDLALWLEDGNIEFLGRIDHQVKIHGNRIELGEIESTLMKDESVKGAVVIPIDGKNDDQYLCAFIVLVGKFISEQDIKLRLERKLPEYMIPHRILVIEEMPLATNGKIDRKALLSKLGNTDDTAKITDDSENNFIWVKLLNILRSKVNLRIPADKITYQDSLVDLGIDSLSFLRVIIDIESEFEFEFNIEDLNASNFQTMGHVTDYIHKNINEKMIS